MIAPQNSPRSTTVDAALWLAVYLLAILVPLFALLPGRAHGFGWDFAMALGYSGLAMLGVQFALTARFKRATAPFGIDIVYYFHRYLAVLALAVTAGHYLVLRAVHPEMLGSAHPGDAPAHMTAGRAALALFAVVIALALLRKRLQHEYDRWRFLHALLTTLAFGLALWHMHGASGFLDTVWKQALWGVYGAFWVALLLYVRLLRPLHAGRHPWTVVEVRPEHGEVWTLALEPRSRTPLRFAPGQFAWLTLRASAFAMREHPFSIASSAERGSRVELSIKELGNFTATIKDVAVGETAWLDAPYGTFSIDTAADAAGYVFVAGGIGIAPVMSMLRTLDDRGDRRPLVLFYGNRAFDRAAFREELEALQARLALRVVHVLLEPPPGWTGERGFVTEDVLRRHLPVERQRLHCFLCGPSAMTASVERALASLGLPAAHVHSEIFDWV
jgi:predicted ferric reductase